MLELLKKRSVLLVQNEGSFRFLNNMVTNDLASDVYCYNYMLTPQGRFLYDFFIYKMSDEEFWIDIDSSSAEGLLKRLNLYNLRSEIEIKDVTAEYCVLYSRKKPELSSEVVFAHQDPRSRRLGFRMIAEKHYVSKLQLTSDNLYLHDKYDNAVPDGVDDLISEHSLIMYFGAEELSAISYSKGCYIGQELVSRAKYQGIVRKKVFKIISGTEIAPIELGDEVTDLNGDKIGTFCSSYKNFGIVLLDEEKYSKLSKKIAIINGNQEVRLEVPVWRD